MLLDEIKPNSLNEKDKKVVDDLMDEFEGLEAKVKSVQSTKHENDEDENKKKKKHHRHRSPDSKHDRKKSRYNIPTNPCSLSKTFLSILVIKIVNVVVILQPVLIVAIEVVIVAMIVHLHQNIIVHQKNLNIMIVMNLHHVENHHQIFLLNQWLVQFMMEQLFQ
jgi:hypothetical protein